MKQSKSFAGVYLLSCVTALAAVVGINVWGDGSNSFPSTLYPAMNSLAWKTRRLDDAIRDGRPPKAIILGSSRVMAFEPKYVQALTGKTTFNYGVYEATPTEYLAQLRYLLRMGCRPELVILGVDEWAFHNQCTFFERASLSHLGLFREVPFPEDCDVLMRSLGNIDWGTTRKSLSRLVKKKEPVFRSIDDLDSIPLLLEDGVVVFAKASREMEAGSFNLAANISAQIRSGNEIPLLQESLGGAESKTARSLQRVLVACKRRGHRCPCHVLAIASRLRETGAHPQVRAGPNCPEPDTGEDLRGTRRRIPGLDRLRCL